MWDSVRNFFAASELTPYGFCLLWRPDILWTHVTSDAIIAPSYSSIPAAITYFVVKRQAGRKGSSLGLAQVYGFATQSGGHAEIKSAPGEGTSVSILIPVSA